MLRYFIWLVAIIFLLIILVILILPGGSKKKISPVTPLYSYANTDAVARITYRGPINNEVLHKSAQIDVSQSEVTYTNFIGYNGQVTSQLNYPSNYNAYNNFLHALNFAGFTLGVNHSPYSDETGRCATGTVYIFEFFEQDQSIERYWSSTCDIPHTFRGNRSAVIGLFQAQVPNFTSPF